MIEEMSAKPQLVDAAVQESNRTGVERAQPLIEKEAKLVSRLKEIDDGLKSLVEVLKLQGAAGFDSVKAELVRGEQDKAVVLDKLSRLRG